MIDNDKKAEAKKLLAQGEEIVHITVDEAIAYHEAVKMKVKPENIVLSVNERKMLQKNAEKYHEKHAMMKKITLDEWLEVLSMMAFLTSMSGF